MEWSGRENKVRGEVMRGRGRQIKEESRTWRQ